MANLNPPKKTEPWKIRPVLIFQTDFLNDISHPSTIIIPLTTILLDDCKPLRFRIFKRENLEEDSDLLLDQIRAIDNSRFTWKKIANLTQWEIIELEEFIKIILGFEE